MNLEDVKKRVAQIDAIKDDGESAHLAEDKLLKDFVRYIAASGKEPFTAIAGEVLKVDDIAFSRWYA